MASLAGPGGGGSTIGVFKRTTAQVAMTIGNYVDGGQKAKELISVSSAQQLWDEWELQCLVLASFTLQAFFLFAAGIRQRNKSAVLRILLWLAYLLADYVAGFVLGRMALKMEEPRHQLVLLWAPALLLHLGGQDTITAFSMEDNELWKRHLLGLLTQVYVAVYVVAKSWRINDGLLVAPVALMFVSGTIKYAERTWALKTANSDTIKDSSMNDFYETMKSHTDQDISRQEQEEKKWWLQEEYADLVQAAGDSFPNFMNALMDIPLSAWLLRKVRRTQDEVLSFRVPTTRAAGAGGDPEQQEQQVQEEDTQGWTRAAGAGGDPEQQEQQVQEEDTFPSRAYKLVEIQLSLMYDHLYTKVGLRYAQRRPVVGLGLPLLTLATTSSALALFTVAARKKGGGASYSAVDVGVTNVLLAGAVALEVLSILAVTLSFRSYCFLRDKLGDGARLTRVVFWLVRFRRPYDKPLWSNKWGQYNLLAGCIKEKQAGVFTRAMRLVGLAGDTELCPISNESKALICNELDDPRRVVARRGFGHGRGTAILSLSGHREKSELHKSIATSDFPVSVLKWHLATDMCFFLRGEPARDEVDGPQHMALAREVSSYLMHLVMERRVLMSSKGHLAHRMARDEVKRILVLQEWARVDAADADAMSKMLESGVGTISPGPRRPGHITEPVLPSAWRLAQHLLQQGQDTGTGGAAAPPWKMIASVWMEMLFHLAVRCEAGFHAKNLSTGGEFITHVRCLLLNRGIGWGWR